MVSHETQKQLVNYFLRLNDTQKIQEAIRQKICQNTYFQVDTTFQRFDKFLKGYLLPSDFAEFMLENDVIPHEEELYMVFKDFDKSKQGVVTIERFEQQMVPRQNSKLRKDTLHRRPYDAGIRLEIDLEFQIAKYFEAKIDAFHSLEKIRASILRDPVFRSVDALILMDTHKTSTINNKQQIDEFLRRNGKCLKAEDLRRIYEALAFHREGPITVERMQEHLEPFKYGFYPLYKQRLAERVEMKQISRKNRESRLLLQEERARSQRNEQIQMDTYLRLKQANQGLTHVLESQELERMSLADLAAQNLRKSREIIAKQRLIAQEEALFRESRLQRQLMLSRMSRLY